MLPLPILKRRADEKRTSTVSLEREGRDEIRRITQAVEKVPWSISLMQILWTAGPVTLIGAWGGYLMGYGKAPTMENYVFFISYTVITGVAGVLANLVHHLTRGRQYERTEAKISRVIDTLPDLILTTRNLIVESLEGDARRREAAAMLLRKQDLSPEGVELAVQELLNDADSARIIARIDIYRRVGLYARIRDLNSLYSDTLEPQFTDLADVAPEAIGLLRDRFYGIAPNLHHGVPRDDNFLERILAASEQDNDLLMTLQDVEELLILAFELISGREITMLTFEYRGQWHLARALDQLEDARARYRIAQATGLSRVKALTVYLAEQSDTLVEDAASGLRAEVLLARSREAMDALADQIVRDAAELERAFDSQLRARLRQQSDILTNALKLFKSVQEAYENAGRSHAQLLRLSTRWEEMHSSEKQTQKLRTGRGRRGLRVREKRIALDDAAKADVCRALSKLMQGVNIRHWGHPRHTPLSHETLLNHGSDTLKRFAIDVALTLEPHIHLSRPEVQRAINATNAAYFGQLEPNMSAPAKAAIGAAMVKSIEPDLSRSAESLALALVRHYGVPLDDSAAEFLVTHYKAREATLSMIAGYHSADYSPVSLLTHRPPVTGKRPQKWYRALVRARRALG
ncbi:hypothetical protein [Larsenimonas salina]|uniref:hypothetical protein n=1 Tax=Larsenimonas salina TaxID=1295565 RepID=UPI0020747060|nr:hypothetical protein [Larsenimonas salina]